MLKCDVDDKDVIPTITMSQSELALLITERDLYKKQAIALMEDVLPRLDENEAKIDATGRELHNVNTVLQKDITLLEDLINALDYFADTKPFVVGCTTREQQWEWYRDRVFNEKYLYETLGKDDARTVLGVFERFVEVSDIVMGHIKAKEQMNE